MTEKSEFFGTSGNSVNIVLEFFHPWFVCQPCEQDGERGGVCNAYVGPFKCVKICARCRDTSLKFWRWREK